MVTVSCLVVELDELGSIATLSGSPRGLARAVNWARLAGPTVPKDDGWDDCLVIFDLTSTDAAASVVRQAVATSPLSAVAVKWPLHTRTNVESTLESAANRAGVAILQLAPDVDSHNFVDKVCQVIARLRVEELGARVAASTQFDEALINGAGLAQLVERAATLVGTSIVVTSAAGRVTAAAGIAPGTNLAQLIQDSPRRADIAARGCHWGTVHIGAGNARSSRASLEAVIDRLPTAISIAVARSAHARLADDGVGADLVADLFAGRIRSADEIAERVQLAGLPIGEDWTYVAASARLAPNANQRVALALRTRDIRSIQAEFVYDVVVLAAFRSTVATDDICDTLLACFGTRQTSSGDDRSPTLAISVPTPDLDKMGRSVREARETLALAAEVGTSDEVVYTKNFSIDRLINRMRHDPELRRFVETVLGPLRRYDASRSSHLVSTLTAYLEAGMSKTQTARMLELRRPSLYRRLARIEELVGCLDDVDTRLKLEIALKADRMLAVPARDAHREAWWVDLRR